MQHMLCGYWQTAVAAVAGLPRVFCAALLMLADNHNVNGHGRGVAVSCKRAQCAGETLRMSNPVLGTRFGYSARVLAIMETYQERDTTGCNRVESAARWHCHQQTNPHQLNGNQETKCGSKGGGFSEE